MISMSRLPGGSNILSRVRIKDSSKYGTFINKNHASNEKVHELPSKETTLKDGDVVCFGTGNAAYRFSFVPFVFFSDNRGSYMIKILMNLCTHTIGACTTIELSDECTHVLTDQLAPVSEPLIDAIVAKKPIMLMSWLELLGEKCIGSEIPSWSSNVPTVAVEGVSVQLVDSITRSKCLVGYSFILDPRQMYLFEDRLPALLEVAGAKTASVEEFCSNSQVVDCGGRSRAVCVTTKASAHKFDDITELSSYSRVDEMDLLCAILSGHLDLSVLTQPTGQYTHFSLHVSLSSTTDETIVADSDTEVEAEMATSVPPDANILSSKVASESENKEALALFNCTAKRLEETYTDASMTTKIEKVDCDDGNSDIIYSQVLIVRGSNLSAAEASSAKGSEVPNFKCFRKKCIQSGNSFSNLIPFSRDPYKESSYDSTEVQAALKEEKKRKQMEAVAEDLFNNERGKKRGTAGSIHGLLSRARAR
ncbi:unnamed protein product [Linum tenue]|uniref:Nibrin n=1 Tax=Linum tenue TaxID=586396 RepID=A0AAV0NXX8_9ROSI|nr:unnamed protein product [Linum tenue]